MYNGHEKCLFYGHMQHKADRAVFGLSTYLNNLLKFWKLVDCYFSSGYVVVGLFYEEFAFIDLL